LFAPFHPQAEAVAWQQGIAYVPLRPPGRRVARPLQWLRLMRLLRRNRHDVWHFHDPELLPLTIVGKWLFARQVHLIYDVHEDVPKDILSKVWIPPCLRKPISVVAQVVERWGMRHCQLVVTVVDSIVARLKAVGQRSILVRNYPLLRQAPDAPRVDRNGCPARVIYPGTLTEARGIRDLVLAVHELQDCGVELVLLGRFYPPAFEQEIRRLAGPNVIIESFVPFDQVPRYLEKSDIGVACFHSTPAESDALPVKMFEYMAAGLPVVVSDFPILRRIVEPAGCGLLVEPGPDNARQIATAIRKLVSDPELRQRMGRAGMRAVTEEYSWQNEVAVLIAEYDRISQALGSSSEG
jgi:glycosyltransferase involved in cell wall biosynthesis